MKYVIITSVYNEEKYLSSCIESVIRQTILPLEWIIIDDNSTDSSPQIILEYSMKYCWIKKINYKGERYKFGEHVGKNFALGLAKLSRLGYDILVKFDGDLCIDRVDYFERLLKEFAFNEKLGIISGITYYNNNGIKEIAWHPEWRTTGALKMYRKQCYDDIGGILPIYGWDGIDDYKAMYRSWQTRTFYELEVNHLGKEKDWDRHKNNKIFFYKGSSYYIRGYSFPYVFLRSIKTAREHSFVSALLYVLGFIYSGFKKQNKVVSYDEQKFIRSFQHQRILKALHL